MLLIAAAFASATAAAVEGEYELRVGGIYSDNIARTSAGDEDETIALIGVSADIAHESKRVTFDLLADLDYQKYVDDFYESEVVGALNAELDLALVSDLLFWNATETFGNLQTNPFLADTRDNRENVSYFSTGPELRLRFGSRTFLELGAQYGKNDFEERPTDNEVVTASVSLIRSLSSNRSIFLTATNDQVEYDDQELNTDFDRRAVFMGFESQALRGDISVSLGANEVEVEGETADGTLATLSFGRELTARTRFSISYDQRFSDAGDIFRRFPDGGNGFGETQPIGGLGSPFESRRASLSLNFRDGSNSAFAALSRADEDYEDENAQERQIMIATLGVTRQLGSNWTTSGDIRFNRTDYQNVLREDEDWSAGVVLSRRFSRSLFVDLRYRFFNRTSTDAVQDYDENRVSLIFRFAPE